MGNNTTTKFDDTIKDTLQNYETRHETGDWERMERMLDAAPKVVNFKWSYLLNVFIGVAVLATGYLIYSAVSGNEPSADNSPAKETIVAPAPVDKVQTKPQPAVVIPPASTSVETTTITTPPAPVTAVAAPALTEKPKVAADKIAGSKTETGKTKGQVPADVDQALKHQKVMGMGNEPVFGDMIDSSKGIVNETKEKESTKTAAKKTTAVPVGWNSIMLSNANLDSLKKYREKNDTLKK